MVEELEFVPTGIKNDAGEEIFLVINEYDRGDHNQAYVKRGDTWLRTRYPDFMSRMSETSSSNPYKAVWDNGKDYYGEEIANSGSAFIPTYLSMAYRHMSRSKFHLRKARSLGRGAASREEFRNALFYQELAKNDMAKHQQILRLSR